MEITEETECSWLEWQCKQHEYIKQNGDGTTSSQTTRKYENVARTGTISELISLFTKELILFKIHFFNINHQYSKYREVIGNLNEYELCILVDFSENYLCKLSSEIQAMHFGASRAQITLHTFIRKITNQSLSFRYHRTMIIILVQYGRIYSLLSIT